MFKINWAEHLVQSAVAVGIDVFLLNRISTMRGMGEEALIILVSAVVTQQILSMITYTEVNQ